ncbi:pyridine nucleotide-disulfide oxidoreductase family protein, partial [Vibrio parahaemolyticus V-223/04]
LTPHLRTRSSLRTSNRRSVITGRA